MKLRLLLFALIMFAIPTYSQSLIGLSQKAVKAVIKKERRDLSSPKKVVTQNYICLKFVDKKNNPSEVTMIVYFPTDDINRCKFSKSCYDYSMQDEVIETLNTQYKKMKRFVWKDGSDEITLTNKEHYFTVKRTSIKNNIM